MVLPAFYSTAEIEEGNSSAPPSRGCLGPYIVLKSWLCRAQWLDPDSNEMKYAHAITVRDTYMVEINIIASLNVSEISNSVSLGEWSLTFERGF